MKQIIQDYKTGTLQSAEVPLPECREGGLLVRTDRTLVSAGTERSIVQLAKKSLLGKAMARPDLVKQVLNKVKKEGLASTFQKVQSKLEMPMPLGYSAAGTVLEVGPGVKGFLPGDRVACAGMGYASHSDLIWVPKNLCVPIPEGVEAEEACFVTLGAIAMQGVRQADVRLGEIVAVVGLGLLGQLAVMLLKAAGCRVIGTDLDPAKNALAKQLGAEAAGPEGEFTAACRDLSGGYGVDAVIITAATKSNAPVELAGSIARKKGRVVVVGAVGMELPRKEYYEKELEFRLSTSYGPGRYDPEYEERGHDYPYAYVRWTEQRNMASFLSLIASKSLDLKPLITHRIPFERALFAYDLIEGKVQEPYLGIVLEYPQRDGEAFSRLVPIRSERAPAPGSSPVIGLIGAGNFATGVLYPQLRKRNPRLRALATSTPAKAKVLSEKLGVEIAASSAEDLFADSQINTVFIATRHHMHAGQVLGALATKKHVFVEKPLCLNQTELESIVQAHDAQSVLMVGFNRRFSPMVSELKRFVGGGRQPLVMTYRINAGSIPQDSWIQNPLEGGGRIIGEVCHFVDLLTFLTGSTPAKVYAETLKLPGADPSARDSLTITLKFRDGSIGTITYAATGDTSFPKEYLEVLAGGRIGVLNDFRELILSGGGQVTRSRSSEQQKGFAEEIESFLDAVQNGKPSPIPFADLVTTTQVTFLIEESINCGRAIVLAED